MLRSLRRIRDESAAHVGGVLERPFAEGLLRRSLAPHAATGACRRLAVRENRRIAGCAEKGGSSEGVAASMTEDRFHVLEHLGVLTRVHDHVQVPLLGSLCHLNASCLSTPIPQNLRPGD